MKSFLMKLQFPEILDILGLALFYFWVLMKFLCSDKTS